MSGKVQIVLTKGDELLVLLGDCLKMDAKVTDNSGKVLGIEDSLIDQVPDL